MSLHRADKVVDDGLDSLIRWALYDSVADAEPSPQVWENIQESIASERKTTVARGPARRKIMPRRLWWGWLLGAGAQFPVPGDPRFAWQRRLHAFDMRAPLSIVRMIEGKMPTLRLVS
jgi:hypothetical protein